MGLVLLEKRLQRAILLSFCHMGIQQEVESLQPKEVPHQSQDMLVL